MGRKPHLAKSSSDAGWAQVRATLEYQAAGAGKQVVLVAAHSTSRDCSGGGKRVENSLAVRTHPCHSCGFIADRDHHAAMNILRAGQSLRGLAALAAGMKRE